MIQSGNNTTSKAPTRAAKADKRLMAQAKKIVKAVTKAAGKPGKPLSPERKALLDMEELLLEVQGFAHVTWLASTALTDPNDKLAFTSIGDAIFDRTKTIREIWRQGLQGVRGRP